MVTDHKTQIQILTHAVQKLCMEKGIDVAEFLRVEFKQAVINRYKTFKYPNMNVTIKHQ